MSGTISLNPLLVTSATNTFGVQSDGYVQGTALDDPAVRYALAGGILASTETIPIWGGIPIVELQPNDPTVLPMTTPWSQLGGVVRRATTPAEITGFTVFNQASAWITTPQSTVPCGVPGMTVPFYRLGSGARIAVRCDPSLISFAAHSVVMGATDLTWAFTDGGLLAPYVGAASEAVTSMTWSTTNGGQVAVVMTAASTVGAVGDVIHVNGVTNTGTGAVALINTDHVVNTWTDNQHFTFLLPGTAAEWGTFAGTITLVTTATGLPVTIRLLSVHVGNCKVVQRNETTGFVTWDDTGSCAIILL